MDRNVGASFTLSVLTVVVFSIVLYQPDQPARPVAAASGPGPVSSSPVEVVEARDPDVIAPALSNRVVEADRNGLEGVGPLGPAVSVRPVSERASPAVARPAVSSPAARARVDRPPGPRGAFTTVRDGEDLAAVARRVYGSEDEASTLWRANRDQLDREDAPLRPGALLRTP